MAKLIDADALLREIDFIPSTMSVCMTMEEFEGRIDMKHECERVIEQMPTIDAIPMWWITEKFLDVLNKDKKLSKAVWLVRKAWQKEQEVHGT